MLRQTNGGFLISQIKQIQGRVLEKLLIRHGIGEVNGAQGRILFVLWREDGLPISEVSKRTGLAKTTLTGMLDRLEEAGLLRRAADAADRRKAVVRLTDAAHNLRAAYEMVSEEMSDLFYAGFTDAEIEALESALNRVLENLTRKEAQP